MTKAYFYTPSEYCKERGIPWDQKIIGLLGRLATTRVNRLGEPTSKRRGGELQRRMVTAYTMETLDAVYREITGR